MQFSIKCLVQGYLLPEPSCVNIKGPLQKLLVFDEETREKCYKYIKQMLLSIGSNTKKS